MEQKILTDQDQYEQLDKWLSGKVVLVVCGKAYSDIVKAKRVVDSHSNVVYFQHYKPNPTYDSVLEGVRVFNDEKCNAVMAVGGGSAIDVAKCIKAFGSMDARRDYLEQSIVSNDIPLLVVPTTAGTGSEATRYAVIYKNGEKQSITSEYLIPDVVLLDPDNLKSLPEYQRKATMMDVLAHSLESMWSINSTQQSMKYSMEALNLFLKYKEDYLTGTSEGNEGMLRAAHIAGKAINITQTTAGHAMCYKITSLFGCAHGHAAMMCNRVLFPWMYEHMERCIDVRGKDVVFKAFSLIEETLNCKTVKDTIECVDSIYSSLELSTPVSTEQQINIMVDSVNIERLRNNPIKLNKADIVYLYRKVFGMTK